MDNIKAEVYLSDRLEMMSDEKVMLITKLNKIQIEIEETDIMINEMTKDVDTAFEVFSPRPKKNDFAKLEIDKLVKRKEELTDLFNDFTEQCVTVEEDIKLLREALGQSAEEGEEIFTSSTDAEQIEKLYGIQILEQQENERSRIARDLHDSIVQVLTNLIHKSEICTKIVDVDAIRAKLELEIMSKTLRETIEEMRNIIYNLRPMSFDDLGFNVTIERFIENVKARTNMNVILKLEGKSSNLSKIHQLTIFRIIQECTTNSIKYANGKNLIIKIRYEDEFIYLEVTDDGIGFDMSQEASEKSDIHSRFGLSIMRERVALLSGRLDIETELGKGTSIKVIVPVE